MARKDIAKTENEMKSLMYEGLLTGLEEQQTGRSIELHPQLKQ